MSARLLALCTSVVLAACGTDNSGGDDDVLGGSRTVTGSVVDFESGDAVAGAASVSTSGVVPSPRVTSQGASFTIEGIPDNSTFQILASVTPTHRPTFGPSIEVLTDDLAGIEAPAVSETFLAGLATAFGITPSAAKGVMIARLVDDSGNPVAGIPGNELLVAGGSAAFFLDDNLAAAPNAMASSNSGYVVFFEVPPGVVELGQAAAPTVTLQMAASPINAGAVTLTTITATGGAPVLPVNVKFSTEIVPIFHNRGCVACHSGGGIGKDLGGLKLDGPASQVYSELYETPSRVQLATPEMSLVLRMPSREDPPDTHPNVTFASNTDPDYLKLLVWIQEGGLDN